MLRTPNPISGHHVSDLPALILKVARGGLVWRSAFQRDAGIWQTGR